MLYIALMGAGPYVYNGQQCLVVKFNDAREGRRYARAHDGDILRKTAHVMFGRKALHISAVAVGEDQIDEALRVSILMSAEAEYSVSRRTERKDIHGDSFARDG
jgi:hypothetical protein